MRAVLFHLLGNICGYLIVDYLIIDMSSRVLKLLQVL